MLPGVQFLLFCFVGLATTVIDFAVFNLLTRPVRGRRLMPVIPANIVAVSVAMTWSFVANWVFVFHPSGQDWLTRAGRFVVTTAFSAFVLQNLVLYVTTHLWKTPVFMALFVARRAGLDRRLDEDAISRNTRKTLAVTVGLIWNFCWYKLFVYAH